MTTALASLLTGRAVKHTVGMTGEVTLQGRVLPIGGLKQKVLAAHAAGLTDVILPERNRADLDDVPEDVREADELPPGHERSARCSSSRSSPPPRSAARRCGVVRCRLPAVPEEVRRAADLLERRYSLSIVYASPLRRVALQRVPAGARARCRRARSPRGSSSSSEAGMLERRVIDSRPPRVEYLLTEKAACLSALLDALATVGAPR